MSVLNNNYYIRFADPAVEEVLKLNMGKDEGEGITVAEAAVANLGTIFKNNTQIETFDELPYFTSPNYGIGAYQNCTNLRRVDVSKSDFPNEIFNECTNLEYFHGLNSVQGELRIKDGVTTINDRALQHTKVRSVIFPDSVRTIKNSFFECSSLQSVTFGTGPLDIKLNAFYQCTNLQEVHVPSLADWEDITFALDNSTANPLSYAHHLYVNGQEVTSITYPSGTTTLKAVTFSGGSSITSVTIPSTVTSIEKNHFANCSNLVIPDLNLPNLVTLGSYAFSGTKVQTISDLGSITNIPEYCFNGCSQLTTIDQGVLDNITALNNEAFRGCTNLVIPDLNLPNLVTLGSYAFSGTKVQTISDLGSITSIDSNCFEGCSQLTSVVIPNTVTSIGYRAFRGCSALTSITIPNSVTSISGGAFYGCAALTSITIPDNVTSDVQEWFHSCEALTTVVLGSGITKIKNFAFRDDRALRSLTVKAVTPPVCEDNALAQSAIVGLYNNYCDIYVPAGSVDAYKTADGWSAAASRIYAIPNS